MLSRMVRGRGRAASRIVVLAVLALAATSVPSGAGAQDADEATVRAAREIQAAQDRANAAAQAMFDAESRIDQLTMDIDAAAAELAVLEAQAGEMRVGLEAAAVRRFVGAGAETNPLLTGIDAAEDQDAAAVLRSIAGGTAAVELDEFDALMVQISDRRDDLERRRDEAAAAREEYTELQARAEAEVLNLQEVEEQRLHDEAVRQELQRQRRERQEREAAEAASFASAAAAQVTPSPQAVTGGGGSGGAIPEPTASPAGSGDTPPSSTAAPPTPTSPTPTPPTPTTPTTAPVVPPSNAGSGMVCPVAGPTAYADTWGAPRSGGRSHQGVDMMAPGGTPLVAVESGSVIFKTSSLGGNVISMTGNSGTYYFYGHLSAWEGTSRSVSQGEVIGYVGATGNTSANHLHFEVHPGGGAAVNPYPYVRAVC